MNIHKLQLEGEKTHPVLAIRISEKPFSGAPAQGRQGLLTNIPETAMNVRKRSFIHSFVDLLCICSVKALP